MRLKKVKNYFCIVESTPLNFYESKGLVVARQDVNWAKFTVIESLNCSLIHTLLIPRVIR